MIKGIKSKKELLFCEEKWLFEKNATNQGVFHWPDGLPAIFGDADAHLIERPGPIRFAKRLPGKTDRESQEFSEEATANNEIPGSVKLEQEGFAALKNFKSELRRRLPEVHLLHH